jgi:putative PEP-CTERM system histidine kinase
VTSFAFVSFCAAALGYVLLSALLIVTRQPACDGRWLLLASVGSALWGGAIAFSLVVFPAGGSPEVAAIPDALRTLAWTWCLLVALPGERRLRNVKGLLSIATLVIAGVAVPAWFLDPSHVSSNVALLALAVVGCLTAEQLLRNSTAEQKAVLRPFAWTVGGMLIYDVFVFSDAVLFGALDEKLWAPRGLLAALAVPFLLVAAKRHPEWSKTLFVSRDVVFYTATLTGIGVYLIAMAAGAYVIREIGGEWGLAVQLAYLVAVLGVLAFALSSARLKAELRVFISKHFFRNRYDYRAEWLRLTRTLSDSNQALPLEQRAIKALCAIVESNAGQLWIDRSGRSVYEPFGAWQAPFPAVELLAGSALVQFLKSTQWVIDTRQYARDPEHYQHAFDADATIIEGDNLVFPLVHEHSMLGIVRIECSANLRELNYEDHDLLKTAGRQVAAFIAHDLAKEQLAEVRQFEAYNKLSAFVMHDLKNLLAQQALLVDNARRFRGRPEFMTDVIATVDNGVQRMRRLLRQLERGVPVAQNQRVELNKLLLRAVSACSDAGGPQCSFTASASLWVQANPDQLTSVIAHLITNAQQASDVGEGVTVRLSEADEGRALIEISDSGSGMSEEFVRKRLFRPFDSTKGLAGMGIGAYQAREVARGLGGDLVVISEPNKGTTVRLWLPSSKAGDEREVSTG